MTNATTEAGARTGIVVPGALGRMGRHLLEAIIADPRFLLLGATVRSGRSEVGQDAGRCVGQADAGVPLVDDLALALQRMPPPSLQPRAGRAAVVDFLTPGQTARHARLAAEAGAAYIVGTTGLSSADRTALDEAAKSIPVLAASNMSLGANLLMRLAALVARAVPDADAEIVELHHKKKKDAPSGTAWSLAEAIAEARGQRAAQATTTARTGHAPREPGAIGVFGVRGGDVVGEHTAYFFLEGERIELVHRASDRRIFAVGALAAARAIVGCPAGIYSMQDVLGLEGAS